MKERPILFSAPMVRAILGGHKTQTRRVIKPQPDEFMKQGDNGLWMWVHDSDERFLNFDTGVCPYGQLGDRLWVRETCRAYELTDDEGRSEKYVAQFGEFVCGLDGVIYEADGEFKVIQNTEEASSLWMAMNSYRGHRGAVVPSIHMPRWASRILLEIVSVRVERLQDISYADAVAEGIEQAEDSGWKHYTCNAGSTISEACPQLSYQTLWESINGPDSWDANPWVWVIEFKRVQP